VAYITNANARYEVEAGFTFVRIQVTAPGAFKL